MSKKQIIIYCGKLLSELLKMKLWKWLLKPDMALGQSKGEENKWNQGKAKSSKPSQNNKGIINFNPQCRQGYLQAIWEENWNDTSIPVCKNLLLSERSRQLLPKHQHKLGFDFNILPFCLRLASIVTKFSKNT